MRALSTLFCLLIVCGCATPSTQTVDTVAPTAVVAPADHRDVYFATLEVLRDLKFRISHKDQRSGQVVTYPRIASSALEPWHDDNATAYLVQESTLNFHRRVVSIRLDPVEKDFVMRVEVRLQRRHHPPRALTEATILRRGGQGVRRQDERSVETERGKEESFWRTLRRDHAYEHRLMHEILKKAARRRTG
jgi:hypothetical protein